MQPITITRERLSLRELAIDDVDAVHAIYGDPQVTAHMSFEPRDRDQVDEIVHRSIASASCEPRVEYALAVIAPDDDLFGFARLAIDPHQQSAATMGFALRRDRWRRGLGTETVRALMDLGFGSLDLHRLWAARSPDNVASHATLIRAGLVEEGRIRGHVQVRGAWRDSVVYGILQDEWSQE